ncbi:MAG: DUF6544 family protein [Bryobacteraceae bacterium]
MRKALRAATIILLSLLALLVIAVGAALILRLHRQHLTAEALAIRNPNGIDEGMYVKIGRIDQSFDLALTDHGRTVSARVVVDGRGAPAEFTSTDRFCFNQDRPKQLMRARWTTPVAAWDVIDGRPLPAAAQAVWRLPQGC